MKAATKWGIISGVAIGLWMIVVYYLTFQGMTPGSMGTIPLWILYSAGIYLSILQTRESELEGFIDFRNAFRAGLQCASLAAVILGLFSFGIYRYMSMNPHLVKVIAPNESEAQIQNLLSLGHQVMTVITTVGPTIIVGAIISAGFSMMLKKQSEPEDK